jgi:hypothetical protein
MPGRSRSYLETTGKSTSTTVARAASRSRRADSHRAITEGRVSIRCPVGPPIPPSSAVPASGSALTYMRGTPRRRPARAPAATSDSATYDRGRTSEGRGIGTHCWVRQKSPRVSSSSATTTSRTSSRSAMVRVCGTTTSIVGTSGQLPRTEITPRDGV